MSSTVAPTFKSSFEAVRVPTLQLNPTKPQSPNTPKKGLGLRGVGAHFRRMKRLNKRASATCNLVADLLHTLNS